MANLMEHNRYRHGSHPRSGDPRAAMSMMQWYRHDGQSASTINIANQKYVLRPDRDGKGIVQIAAVRADGYFNEGVSLNATQFENLANLVRHEPERFADELKHKGEGLHATIGHHSSRSHSRPLPTHAHRADHHELAIPVPPTASPSAARSSPALAPIDEHHASPRRTTSAAGDEAAGPAAAPPQLEPAARLRSDLATDGYAQALSHDGKSILSLTNNLGGFPTVVVVQDAGTRDAATSLVLRGDEKTRDAALQYLEKNGVDALVSRMRDWHVNGMDVAPSQDGLTTRASEELVRLAQTASPAGDAQAAKTPARPNPIQGPSA